MRYSQMLLPTLKEIPSEAETISHQLLLRAGMIRKLTSGIYDYLPLGLRVLRKIEANCSRRNEPGRRPGSPAACGPTRGTLAGIGPLADLWQRTPAVQRSP